MMLMMVMVVIVVVIVVVGDRRRGRGWKLGLSEAWETSSRRWR